MNLTCRFIKKVVKYAREEDDRAADEFIQSYNVASSKWSDVKVAEEVGHTPGAGVQVQEANLANKCVKSAAFQESFLAHCH